MSNIVFSVKLSLGDAIAAAGKYKSKFKASELENNFQVDVEGISDEQISKHSYWNKLICLCNCTRDPAESLMTFVPGRRQVPDHPCLPIRTLKET
jgi:hypothetical protein